MISDLAKLLSSIAIIAFFALAPQPSSGAEKSVQAPSVQSILGDLPIPAAEIGMPYLLAWKYEADERPLYLESALLALKMKNQEWQLLMVVRHSQEPTAHWTIGTISYHPDPDRRILAKRNAIFTYKNSLKEEQVETFIRDTSWPYTPSTGFRLIDGNVYSDAWQQAFGFKPGPSFTNLATDPAPK